MGGTACMGEKRNAHKILVGKPERRTPRGRPVRRWEENIKMDWEIGLGDAHWFHLVQDTDR
jgi:hypothetical protein